MDIVFFFDQPPKVGKGCFNAISMCNPGKVIYAYLHDFDSVRKAVNWDDGDFGQAKLVELGEGAETQNRVDALFAEYPDAIFVLGGFKSHVTKYVNRHIFSKQYCFVVFSERPGVYGTWWKRLLKQVYIPISELFISWRYEKYITAMLPLGLKGVRTFHKYGWPEEKLFPFMYDPVETIKEDSIIPVSDPMRFLYVGRFSRYTKGTDTLIKAVDLLGTEKDRFTLSMVGGYGDMRDEILEWIEKKENVEFLGKWDSNEVCKKMKDYDVCIVPSKFDGWNLLVNEAVRAHIGVIATDEAVSDEVIRNSRSGIVVPADSPRKLADAMKSAINNPQLVLEWKIKAKHFSPQISNDMVASYVLSIIDFVCLGNGIRPQCPWLKENDM